MYIFVSISQSVKNYCELYLQLESMEPFLEFVVAPAKGTQWINWDIKT
jgi:hypothetical protein